jgi:hypothetical protein
MRCGSLEPGFAGGVWFKAKSPALKVVATT